MLLDNWDLRFSVPKHVLIWDTKHLCERKFWNLDLWSCRWAILTCGDLILLRGELLICLSLRTIRHFKPAQLSISLFECTVSEQIWCLTTSLRVSGLFDFTWAIRFSSSHLAIVASIHTCNLCCHQLLIVKTWETWAFALLSHEGLVNCLVPSVLIGHEDILALQSIVYFETWTILLDWLHTNGWRCGEFPLVNDLHCLRVPNSPLWHLTHGSHRSDISCTLLTSLHHWYELAVIKSCSR